MPAGNVASDIENAPPVVSAVAFMTAVLAPAAMRSPCPGRRTTASMRFLLQRPRQREARMTRVDCSISAANGRQIFPQLGRSRALIPPARVTRGAGTGYVPAPRADLRPAVR